MKLSIGAKIFLGFVVNIIVVIATGYISLQRANNLKEKLVLGDLYGHQQRVNIATGKIISVVNNMDNMAKGFVLTGNKKYSDVFNNQVLTIQSHIDDLRELYSNNNEQLTRIDDLRKVTEEKVQYDNHAILAKELGNEAVVKNSFSFEKDFVFTDKIVKSVFKIRTQESLLFNKSAASIDRIERNLQIVYGVLLFGSIVLLIVVYFIIRYYIRANSRIEEAEREEKQLLQSIIDNTSNAIFLKKINGEYLLINKKAETYLHKTNEEVKGKTEHDVFPKALADTLREADLEVMKAGKEITFDTILPLEDGPHTLSVTRFPLFDAVHKIYAIVGISMDVTESKKLENQLKDSEERFRLLVDTIKDYAIFTVSSEGTIMTWNRGGELIFGYAAQEIIGRKNSLLFPPDEIEKGALKDIMQSASKEDRTEFEGWRLKKDGSRFYVNAITRLLYDTSGKIKGFAVVVRDITEKQKTEQQLRESEEQLQTIFNSSPDALIVINEEGNIIKWNPKAESIFDYKLAEVIGKPMVSFIMPERYKDEHFKAMKHFIETGEGKIINKPVEYTALNKKNIEFDIEYTVSPAKVNGKYIFIAFLKDISARKKLEKQILESQQFLDSIVANIPNMIFVKDAKTLKYLRLNKTGEKMLGKTEKEVLSKTDHELFAKDTADFYTNKDKEALLKLELVDIPEEPVDTPGGERWLHTQKIPIVNEQGNPVYLLGISQDITERRKIERERDAAEKHLRDNEKRMKLILENLGEGVVVANIQEKIIMSNHLAEEIIGVIENEEGHAALDLSTRFELYYPDERTIFPAQNLPLERALKGESTEDVEIILEDLETKTKKRVLMNGRPIKDDKNRVIAAVSTIRDITNYRRMEEALEESEQKYRKLIGFSREDK